MDIVEKIREQIAQHRAEILRLESALEVIAEMGGKSAKREAPLITVRKVIDHESEKLDRIAGRKPKERKRHKVSPSEIDAAVVAYLKAHGPSRSIDVGKSIKVESKRLWSRLWHMSNKSGVIVKDAHGVYRLPEEAPAEDGGSSQEAA